MSKKSIILSASGLQNLVQNVDNEQNCFCFIFGQHKLKMSNIFAEFISPTVSQLHKTDPTINSIQYDNLFTNDSKVLIEEIFTDETLSLLKTISCGLPIEINHEQGFNMQLISIILNNEELFEKINKIYQFNINESNIDYYLQHLQVFHNFLGISRHFNYSKIIDFIASHFYIIDENKLVKLPKSTLYSIISNQNFKIKDEDSFLDFINTMFSTENDKNNENLTKIDFLEKIEFSGLSESKFQEFLKNFEFNEMTTEIWQKLCRCFISNFSSTKDDPKDDRYLREFICYKYDNKEENSLNGIIRHLTFEFGGNVDTKGIVKISSSSIYYDHYPKTVADFDDVQHFYESNDQPNSWIKFDFSQRKVRPTHYSIRTRNAGKGSRHLKNWVIEASNSNSESDWNIIDFRNDISSLDGKSITQTFEIQNKLSKNESFRYLRIRQTGVNTSNDHFLTLSALEFFGYIQCE